ncbi:hypothetical protein V8G54_024480 [Vigna mungo]|uniref:Aquaporin n=1 Tax=Vigna mungo TaxID=3915 RepID=A0AAQ3N5Z6_VIGMU
MAEDVEQGEYPARDYYDPPPAPLFDRKELTQWSFYRAIIAEFIATLLFLYVTVLTIIGNKRQIDTTECDGVGIIGVAWAFGGMIFILVYCTAGISGIHLSPLSISSLSDTTNVPFYAFNFQLLYMKKAKFWTTFVYAHTLNLL